MLRDKRMTKRMQVKRNMNVMVSIHSSDEEEEDENHP